MTFEIATQCEVILSNHIDIENFKQKISGQISRDLEKPFSSLFFEEILEIYYKTNFYC